jgi:predicted RNA-binding protein with PUA domain
MIFFNYRKWKWEIEKEKQGVKIQKKTKKTKNLKAQKIRGKKMNKIEIKGIENVKRNIKPKF